jgi:WD40 repeat protein
VAFRGDGARLATGADDLTVRVWDAATGLELKRLEGNDGWVWAVAFAPAGDALASAGADGAVRLWGARPEAPPLALHGHQAGVRGVAFSPDGARLASVGQDGSLRFWDAHRDPRARALPGPGGHVPQAVAFRPGGELLVARPRGDTPGLEVWDAAAGVRRALKRLPDYLSAVRGRGHTAISADGRRVAGPGQARRSDFHVWDADTGATLATVASPLPVQAAAFSPDGRRLAALGFDAAAFQKQARPVGNRLLVWEWETGRTLLDVPLTSWPVHTLTFTPDGRRLVLSGGVLSPQPGANAGEVQLFDASTGERLWRATPENCAADVAVSPDGRWLATVCEWEDVVRVWDAATGAAVEVLKGSRRLAAVAFSPDGRRLAAAGLDPELQVWDVATWQEVLTLRAPVEARPEDRAFRPRVAFSPDGTRIAATTWDGGVAVWDAGPADGGRPPRVAPDE